MWSLFYKHNLHWYVTVLYNQYKVNGDKEFHVHKQTILMQAPKYMSHNNILLSSLIHKH